MSSKKYFHDLLHLDMKHRFRRRISIFRNLKTKKIMNYTFYLTCWSTHEFKIQLFKQYKRPGEWNSSRKFKVHFPPKKIQSLVLFPRKVAFLNCYGSQILERLQNFCPGYCFIPIFSFICDISDFNFLLLQMEENFICYGFSKIFMFL